MSEKNRLRDNLFTKVSLNSEIEKQCLKNMINLCISKKNVTYYSRKVSVSERYSVCFRKMFKFVTVSRSKLLMLILIVSISKIVRDTFFNAKKNR